MFPLIYYNINHNDNALNIKIDEVKWLITIILLKQGK